MDVELGGVMMIECSEYGCERAIMDGSFVGVSVYLFLCLLSSFAWVYVDLNGWFLEENLLGSWEGKGVINHVT